MNFIFMLVAMAAMYFVLEKVYAMLWYQNLSVDVSFNKKEVACGEELILIEEVANDKKLPLPMINVKFQLDKNLVFGAEEKNSRVSDKVYKNDVFSLMFHQKITRSIHLKCVKRGYYTLNEIEIVSMGLFYNDILHISQKNEDAVAVWPELISTDEINLIFNNLVGTVSAQRSICEDPYEFRAIREYQQYDSMKSINWMATAKTGDFKVNVHEYSTYPSVFFLINVATERMTVNERIQEMLISTAASLMDRLAKSSIRTGYISNARDIISNEISYCDSVSDSDSFYNAMYNMARMNTGNYEQSFYKTITECENIIPKESMLVILTDVYSKDADIYNTVQMYRQEGREVLLLGPVYDSDGIYSINSIEVEQPVGTGVQL